MINSVLYVFEITTKDITKLNISMNVNAIYFIHNNMPIETQISVKTITQKYIYTGNRINFFYATH